MTLGPWALFLGMVAVTAGLPLHMATLRPALRTNLLYGYLGVLQLLRGFLAISYAMPLAEGLVVVPNNVLYTAIMMTSILLVLAERRTGVLRTVILVLLGTEAIKLAAIATTRWALASPDFVNVAGVSPEMFDGVLRISAIGNGLIIAELLVAVAVLERLRTSTDKPRLLALWCVAVFCLAVIADGVLFPLFTESLAPGWLAVAEAGIVRKVLLAVAFGVPLLVFTLVRPEPMRRYLTTSLRLRDVLFAPRHHLIARLAEQEVERVELLERTVHVAEDERRRLAGELHDDAIQLLTAADIHLQRLAAAEPEVDLATVQRLVRSGVGALRRHILELRGPDVTARGFEPLVRGYIERLLPEGGLDVELRVDLPDDTPEEVVAGAYRIVLESLANVVRHAGAQQVTVDVTVEEGRLVGRVVDDGIGIPRDAETGPGHLGLRAMRDRSDVLGGRLTVRGDDGGTVVAFELPVTRPD